MTAITFAVQFTGSPDADDRRASLLILNEENARLTAYNVEATAFNATNPPPVTPRPLLTLLPVSTGAERKSSYETMLAVRITQVHEKYIKQATELVNADTTFQDLRPLWADANSTKKAAAVAALQ